MKWELRTLGDLGEWGSGGTPLSSTPEYYNGTIPWLIIEDLNDSVVTSSQKTITELGLKNSSAKIVEPGTLLIAMYGSIGKLGVAGIRCATNQAIAFCRHNPELVDVNFLFYYLLFSREKLLDMGKGNTQQNIGQAVLKEYPIPLPPLTEQKRIASLLARADRLRSLRRTARDLGDSLLQSVFLEMFGEPKSNPNGYDVYELGEIGTLDRGRSKNRPRNAPELYGGKYPFIQTGDIANAGSYIKSYQQTYSELGLKQSKIWKAGTLCITIAANIAKTAILTFDACFPDSVVGFVPNEKTNVEYVQYWLSFKQQELEDTAPESAQKNINLEILRGLAIPVPPLNLQEEFAFVVARVEQMRARQAEGERQAEGLFESLLSESFA